ncbi:sensor histidine kinase [Streptomyces radiopugnans]|uniref:Two-component system, NarL family, sensor histidine kinase DesK n=1 Tax=Streptomyces radiopugnans TaxID=403935 RepID=A0A1H9CYH8_9ACTN|nr:histidine kinase [Streptomyces radiopugnans]SEQ05608.1 two-component system, NarL family, sensor histidine kinase DesK [Streptomyces radiopugnans]
MQDTPDSASSLRAPAQAGARSTYSRWSQARHRELPAPKLARTIAVATLVYYSGISLLNVLRSGAERSQVLLCLGCVAAVFVFQFLHISPRAQHWPLRRRCATLLAQAVLTYLPFLFFGLNWGSMAGPLAGSMLLLLPGRVAWPSYAVIACTMLAMTASAGLDWVTIAYLTTSTMMAGLILYGTARLSDLVAEVQASRAEMARMAVTEERLRFARDLHDLLGYSLSAITLKSELIYRLVHSRPDRAREEIASVLEVSRQALSDVRLVASGYRDMSLAAEAESAAAILATADIRAETDVSCGRLHPVTDTVLATSLREGVTNILRHSKAQTCVISVESDGETVVLRLVNDGVAGQRPDRSPHSGSGLGNLRTRLAAIGGGVEAGVREDGRFHLVARAPAHPAAAAHTPEAGGLGTADAARSAA